MSNGVVSCKRNCTVAIARLPKEKNLQTAGCFKANKLLEDLPLFGCSLRIQICAPSSDGNIGSFAGSFADVARLAKMISFYETFEKLTSGGSYS